MDTARKIQDKIAQMQKTFECPICLELMKNPVSTKCDHKFCRHCLLSALGKKTSAPCPLCKETFTKRSLQNLPKWNDVVTTVDRLVTAYQQDTGQPFSPPKGPPLPASQSSQQEKRKAKCRRAQRKTNFEGDQGNQNDVPKEKTGQKRKAEEVVIYTEDIEDQEVKGQMPELPPKSHVNIKPAFTIGTASKRRKPGGYGLIKEEGSRPPVIRSKDLMDCPMNAPLAQLCRTPAIASDTLQAPVLAKLDRLIVAAPKGMKCFAEGSDKGQHDAGKTKCDTGCSKRAGARQAAATKSTDPLLLDFEAMDDVEGIDTKPGPQPSTSAGETIAARTKTARRTGCWGEASISDLQDPLELHPQPEDGDFAPVPEKSKKERMRRCQPKLNRPLKPGTAMARSHCLAEYLETAAATGLGASAQDVKGSGKIFIDLLEDGPGNEEKQGITYDLGGKDLAHAEKAKLEKLAVASSEKEPEVQDAEECQPTTEAKVRNWLAVACHSVSPLPSDISKLPSPATEDFDDIPSQAVGHELELCLQEMTMCEEAAAVGNDSDDDDVGLIIRTDSDGDSSHGSHDDANCTNSSHTYESSSIDAEAVFGPCDSVSKTAVVQVAEDTDDIPQNQAKTKRGRIFKTKCQAYSSIPDKAYTKVKYKIIGTPDSDDPYAFKPSQSAPKGKRSKKGGKMQAKKTKPLASAMFEEVPTGDKSKLNEEPRRASKSKLEKHKKKERGSCQKLEEERRLQELSKAIDKISEAEEFELMLSQQYRDMVSEARKECKAKHQGQEESFNGELAGPADDPQAKLAQAGKQSQKESVASGTLSLCQRKVVRKRVTIGCRTDVSKKYSATAGQAGRAVEMSTDVEETPEPVGIMDRMAEPETGIIQETPHLARQVKTLQASTLPAPRSTCGRLMDSSIAGEVRHQLDTDKSQITVPNTRKAWRQLKKMAVDLGPKTKRLDIVKSQNTPFEMEMKSRKKTPVADASTDEEVIISDFMSEVQCETEDKAFVIKGDTEDTGKDKDNTGKKPEVKGHSKSMLKVKSRAEGTSKVKHPANGMPQEKHGVNLAEHNDYNHDLLGLQTRTSAMIPEIRKGRQPPSYNSSDTESLPSPESPVQFEPPNLDIQPESIKRQLLQEYPSLSDVSYRSYEEVSLRHLKTQVAAPRLEDASASVQKQCLQLPSQMVPLPEEASDVAAGAVSFSCTAAGSLNSATDRKCKQKAFKIVTTSSESLLAQPASTKPEGLHLAPTALETQVGLEIDEPHTVNHSSEDGVELGLLSFQPSKRRTFALNPSPGKSLPNPPSESMEVRSAIEEALEMMEDGNSSDDEFLQNLILRPAGRRVRQPGAKSVLRSSQQKAQESTGKDVLKSARQMDDSKNLEELTTGACISEDVTTLKSTDLSTEMESTGTVVSATTGASDPMPGSVIPLPVAVEPRLSCRQRRKTFSSSMEVEIQPKRSKSGQLRHMKAARDSPGTDSKESSAVNTAELDAVASKTNSESVETQEVLTVDSLPRTNRGKPSADSEKGPELVASRRPKPSHRALRIVSPSLPSATEESEASVSLLCPGTTSAKPNHALCQRPHCNSPFSAEGNASKPEKKGVTGIRGLAALKKFSLPIRTGNCEDEPLNPDSRLPKIHAKMSSDTDVHVDISMSDEEVPSDFEGASEDACCQSFGGLEKPDGDQVPNSLDSSNTVPPTQQGDSLIKPLPRKISMGKPLPQISARPSLSMTQKLLLEDVDDETEFLGLTKVEAPATHKPRYKKKLLRPRTSRRDSNAASGKAVGSIESQQSVSLLDPKPVPSSEILEVKQVDALDPDTTTKSASSFSANVKNFDAEGPRDRIEQYVWDKAADDKESSTCSSVFAAVPPSTSKASNRAKKPRPCPGTQHHSMHLTIDEDAHFQTMEVNARVEANIAEDLQWTRGLSSRINDKEAVVVVESDAEEISLSPSVAAVEDSECEDFNYVCMSHRLRRHSNRPVISDSEDPEAEEVVAQNVTSSSVLSTGTCTEEKQDLQRQCRSIESQIAHLEAQLAGNISSQALRSEEESCETHKTVPCPTEAASSSHDTSGQPSTCQDLAISATKQTGSGTVTSQHLPMYNGIIGDNDDDDDRNVADSDQELFETPNADSPPPFPPSPSLPPSELADELATPIERAPELIEASRVLEELRCSSSLPMDAAGKLVQDENNTGVTCPVQTAHQRTQHGVLADASAGLNSAGNLGQETDSSQDRVAKVSSESVVGTSSTTKSLPAFIRGPRAPAQQQRPDWVFITSGINRVMQKPYVEKLCKLLGCQMVSQYSEAVTHVLVKPASEGSLCCARTLKYFQGIAGRKYVLSVQWAIDCIKQSRLLDEEPYEIVEDTVESCHYGPRRSRKEALPLLDAYEICCQGDFNDLTKENLTELVLACGGKVTSSPELFRGKHRRLQVILVEGSNCDFMPELRKLHKYQKVPILMKEWLLDSIGPFDVKPMTKYQIFSN